jgi:hypothetical protein
MYLYSIAGDIFFLTARSRREPEELIIAPSLSLAKPVPSVLVV